MEAGEQFPHREVIADSKLKDISPGEEELVVWQDEIPSYFDGETMEALQLWCTYKKFGLPDARGWIYNSKPVMDVLDVLEGEANRPRND